MKKGLGIIGGISLVTIAYATTGVSSIQKFQGPTGPVAREFHATEDDNTGWEKSGDDDGILSERKELPGNPVIAFRGAGVIDAPILRVASVLVDNKRAQEWVDSLTEARTLKKISLTEYVEYDHIGTPFVLKDRDFVLYTKIEANKTAKTLFLGLRSIDDTSAPKTDYVRGQMSNSYYFLRAIDDTHTYMIAEIHADPMGAVPKWIVNLFQKGWAHNTFVSLRKQVAKNDITIHPLLVDIFK